MFIVRYYFQKVVFMVLLNVIVETQTGKIENGFGFGFERGVEGIPSWLKASNSSHVEEGGNYHSTTKVKTIGRAFPKEKC